MFMISDAIPYVFDECGDLIHTADQISLQEDVRSLIDRNIYVMTYGWGYFVVICGNVLCER